MDLRRSSQSQSSGDDIFKVSFDFDQLKKLLSTIIGQVKDHDGRLAAIEDQNAKKETL